MKYKELKDFVKSLEIPQGFDIPEEESELLTFIRSRQLRDGYCLKFIYTKSEQWAMVEIDNEEHGVGHFNKKEVKLIKDLEIEYKKMYENWIRR